MATNLSSSLRRVSLSSDEVPDHPVVAAIDFGTFSSGYAFWLHNTGSADIKISDIQLNKWQIGSASSSTDKAPTTVLLNPDRTFHSFGYEAESKYAELCEFRKQQGWWYFEKFKMMLYKSKISRDMILPDAEGKPMSAKYVFSVVIGHLKECVLEKIMLQNPSIKDDDILYVLTVPAIWSDAAKQFMREAATDPSVGITDTQLKLVLEPEAASLFCRQFNAQVVRESSGSRLASLDIGHKYILVDLGGGTADIATHEIIKNGHLHEIDYARGDSLGGQKFNEDFLRCLSELVGRVTFRNWQLSEQADSLKLQRGIEGIKWKIEDPATSDDDIFLDIPFSLIEQVETDTRQSLEERISRSKHSSEIKLDDDKLCLKSNFVSSFLDPILTDVTQHLRHICQNTSGIETVFMVGGLAQSSYVLKFIETKLPQCKFLVPAAMGVAVLKGAVMLGNKPHTIAGRIARYTYGINVTQDFVEGKHNEKYKFTRDGEVLCDNVFWKVIEKGQVLKYGDTFTTTTYILARLVKTKEKIFNTYLYHSTSKYPKYVTEKDCTELGGIQEYPPENGWPRKTKSKVKIIVGEAEFKFHVKDSLGRKYETTVDFIAQK